MNAPDVYIAGGGLLGLACALELRTRGARVTVLERGKAGRGAAWAAAGMLAAHDAANPPQLLQIAEYSSGLYAGFLEQIASAGGGLVSFQSEWVLEKHGLGNLQAELSPAGLVGRGWHTSCERSIDPRGLVSALLMAVRAAGVDVMEGVEVQRVAADGSGLRIETSLGAKHGEHFLDCTGAWSKGSARPVKGQMLRVHAPAALATSLGNVTVRTAEVYMVPRLDGSVVIGSTLEDAGFDTSTNDAAMDALRTRAAALLPALGNAPELERWAGLRPDTPDHLPLIGETEDRQWVAAGHFRNGVLLAPATAKIMAAVLLSEPSPVPVDRFHPLRFRDSGRGHRL